MEGMNVDLSGSEYPTPQLSVLQGVAAIPANFAVCTSEHDMPLIFPDSMYRSRQHLDDEIVTIKDGSPPDLKAFYWAVPTPDINTKPRYPETFVDGERRRKVRHDDEITNWAQETSYEDDEIGDEDLVDCDEDWSTTDATPSSYDGSSKMELSSTSSTNHTSMEDTLEGFLDLTRLDLVPSAQDQEMWRNRIPTLLMLWAIEQARLRKETADTPGMVYQHIPFPDTSHTDIDAKVSDFSRTARMVPVVPGGPSKQPKFCSTTPPVNGASVYSRPCPKPTRGYWKPSNALNFFSNKIPLTTKPMNVWIPRQQGSALTKPAFSQFFSNSSPSCVGAVATMGVQGSELMVYSWGGSDAWPHHSGLAEGQYQGRRWKMNYARPLPRVRPTLYSYYRFILGGHISCAKTMEDVTGCAWTSKSDILVYGTCNGLPVFEQHSVDWQGTESVIFQNVKSISLPCTAPVREVLTEGAKNEIIAGFDDGSLLMLPTELLGTEKAAQARTWSFDSSIGSIKRDPNSPDMISLTLDFPEQGSQYVRIDTRQPESSGPCMRSELDRLTYSHDYGWDRTIICGDSLGFVTLYDDRKLGSSYYEIFKDHSNCAIADVKYDQELRLCTLSGSPSCSYWEHQNNTTTLRHVANTMLDQGILPADHQVHATNVPGTSLVALSSSAGSLGLLDL